MVTRWANLAGLGGFPNFLGEKTVCPEMREVFV
jgi:hypothetical protein